MITGRCHCGNITLEVAALPETLTSCNCSICHRLGALWAYYPPEDVKITEKSTPSIAYRHGEKNIAFHHCPLCGCTTHYHLMDEQSGSETKLGTITALNARMLKSELIAPLKILHFDGAVSWDYLEE